MHIDNRRWFLVTVVIPSLGSVSVFAAMSALTPSMIVTWFSLTLVGLLFAGIIYCVRAALPAMDRVRLVDRGPRSASGSLYRSGPLLAMPGRTLEHSANTFPFMMWSIAGPFATLYFLYGLAVLNGLFRVRLYHVTLLEASWTNFMWTCGGVYILLNMLIAALSRRKVIKSALRDFWLRQQTRSANA